MITSQEIDELGEADNTAQARLQIDGVLSHLRRGLRVLADQGIKTIVLVADHGHLFADEMGEDMKIDAPGGKVEDLHRRVWVGVGGNSGTVVFANFAEPRWEWTANSTLRPRGLSPVFKSPGGGRAYFPRRTVTPRSDRSRGSDARGVEGARSPSTGIQWRLTPGSAKLTTRFFSVQVAGSQSESSLFGFEPPKVRIELRANKKLRFCSP